MPDATKNVYMPGIISITFSPCIDKSTCVEELIPEKKLACAAPVLEPGGGGINVARAIRKLGGTATAIYPSGGYTGKFLDSLMRKEEVPAIVIETISETRENIIVFESGKKRQYRFGMPGSVLLQNEWQSCLQAVEEQKEASFIVASGSLPPGVPVDVFAMLAKIARKNNAKLVVDTKGAALQHAVSQGVYLIKPNLGELCSLAGIEKTNDVDAVAVSKKLIASVDCSIIVVSLGPGGALLVTKNNTYHVAAPSVEVKSTVGAGDSMVAGIVYSLYNGDSIKQALQYGVACGTAATLHSGTELCRRSDADKLYDVIRGSQVQGIAANLPL